MNFNKIFIKLGLVVFFNFIFVSVVSAASFSINPSTGNVDAQCTRSFNIVADASGQSSNAADIIINYDPSKIDIIDSNSDIAGTQIQTGNAYEVYFINDVNETTGQIKIATGSFGANLTTSRVLATVFFESKPGATSANFNIDFAGVGNTLDSNIADSATSNDLLTSVTNANYTFVANPCEDDSLAPQISFQNPTNNQRGVSPSQNIEIRLTDNQSGVDLTSLEIFVNGFVYNTSDLEVQVTGDPNVYSVIINPLEDFPVSEPSTIQVRVGDLAGNFRVRQIVFNYPEDVQEELVCPVPEVPIDEVDDEEPGIEDEEVTDPEVIIREVCTTTEPEVRTLTRTVEEFRDVLNEDVLLLNFPVSPLQILIGFSGFLLILSGFNILTLLLTPGLIGKFIQLIFLARKNRPTGIVLDLHNGKPIPFATLRLYVANTNNLKDQTVSDNRGVYSFNFISGEYRLEVKAPNYATHIQNILITQENKNYLQDIKLTRADLIEQTSGNFITSSKLWQSWSGRLKKIITGILNFFFVLGFIISTINVLLFFNLLNFFIFLLYILVIVGTLIFLLRNNLGEFSLVDEDTGFRIPRAILKVYDPQTGDLREIQTTNEQGFFQLNSQAKSVIVPEIFGYELTQSNRLVNFGEVVGVEFINKLLPNNKIYIKSTINRGR